MVTGLSTSEAKIKLAEAGYNELASARPKNIRQIATEVMREPMFLLLISCGVLYIILGDYREGIIMLFTIFIIIFITFYQYRKTERALDALKRLSSPRALVLRNGVESRIPGREVVPDDILILNEGDRIAADAIILDSLNLTIDESLLTGESLPVLKTVKSELTDTKGLVFSGTLVVQGKAVAKVKATGFNTAFGKIGISLKTIEQGETSLQKEMKALIRNLFLAAILISVAIIIIFYLTRGNFIKSLLNGLAAAMAILPEEFPVVLTVFLALGAWRLSKRNILTRKPSAIETLGSATVLCSDKTGTITQNKMEVAAMYNGNEIFYLDSIPENNGRISEIISKAHYASQTGSVDPMEIAIRHAHERFTSKNKSEYRLIKEYPLTRELFAMTRVVEDLAENTISVSAKGAPESIFSLCQLNEKETAKHLKAVQTMAEQGYRVIAVASALQQKENLPEKQNEFEFSFNGLIGLEDPVRPEVPQAIKECNEAGVKVIMITGDFPATAKSIATQIGLTQEGNIITGSELTQMSDDELKKKITGTTIFARVVPEQKLRIVQALKATNEIVAMTGDGVNDAPALKAAHIGVAMGNKGTDVAREASSLVLLDDNFASIVSAIRSGRRIYDNLQKAMSYILAIHVPIIGLTLLPAFLTTIPILLMPLHIVFMELIIDPVCSIAFETEQEEKGIMNRPPRKPDEDFFGSRKIKYSLFGGLLLLTVVVGVYFISLNEGHTEGEVRAIAFSTLIIGNIFLIVTNLSKTRSVLSIIAEKNFTVMFILLSAFILLLFIIFIPGLQQVFSFQFPGYKHFIPSVTGAFILLLILEGIKYLRNR
jgi:Ca2+-transporting ATPase